MGFLQRWATKLGLINAKMPEKVPSIAVYSLLVLDGLVHKYASLNCVKQAIKDYPEDTHREGFVCKNRADFVAVFESFEHLRLGVEQRFDEDGGRKV